MPLNSPETGGRFRVWLSSVASANENGGTEAAVVVNELLWDRKVEGGFPELKVLVRDLIHARHWGAN